MSASGPAKTDPIRHPLPTTYCLLLLHSFGNQFLLSAGFRAVKCRHPRYVCILPAAATDRIWLFMELKAGIFRNCTFVVALLSAICLSDTIHALTDSQDVYALNQLYLSLSSSSASLVGWSPSGGDPCMEYWEGVACAGPNVTILNLTRLNLMDELTPALQNLTALIVLDLSHNHLVGGLPAHLPPHVLQLDLSDNAFTGNIPFSFSSLSNLAQLNLSYNSLSGILIDMWDQLEYLLTLDLSNNAFDGSVPQSFQDLTSLTELYLQNNHFSGSINMLADLPLTDLNLSNNELTGWIPSKLQGFPPSSFAGNLFNTFPAPPPPPPSPSSPLPLSGGFNPSTDEVKPPSTSTRKQSSGSGAFLTVGRVIGIAAAGLLGILVVVLIIALVVSRSHRQRKKKENYSYKRREEKYDVKESWSRTFFSRKGDKRQPFVLVRNQKEESSDMVARIPPPPPRSNEASRMDSLRPPPLPVPPPPRSNEASRMDSLRPPPLPFEGYEPENSQQPTLSADHSSEASALRLPPTSSKGVKQRNRKVGQKSSTEGRVYTIAELQVATQSFAAENLIGEGTTGKVYKADGLCDANEKIMVVAAIKKLDWSSANNNDNKKKLSDAEFVELVLRISQVEHPNVTRLRGFCVAHGERLLVYDFVSNGSLHEHLHHQQHYNSNSKSNSKEEEEEESSKSLTWEARVNIAVGVARALEFLHEKCEPPLFHGNVTSTNILLDDALLPHLSDTGVRLLLLANEIGIDLPSPERLAYVDPGSERMTAASDIFSFGVVMLELLTGRKAFDGVKPRPEQYLVRWAVQQLHDIDALQRMVDPLLIACSAKSLSMFADIISRCVQTQPEFRPSMSTIIPDLERLLQM